MDENHKLMGNFEKIFEKFKKISYEICEECIILAYFSKTLTNHALNFRAFERNPESVGKFCEFFDENSIEKFKFKYFLKICY